MTKCCPKGERCNLLDPAPWIRLWQGSDESTKFQQEKRKAKGFE